MTLNEFGPLMMKLKNILNYKILICSGLCKFAHVAYTCRNQRSLGRLKKILYPLGRAVVKARGRGLNRSPYCMSRGVAKFEGHSFDAVDTGWLSEQVINLDTS